MNELYRKQQLMRCYPWRDENEIDEMMVKPDLTLRDEDCVDTTEVQKEMDLLYPVDERTGVRVSALSQISNPHVPTEIKDIIARKLVEIHTTDAHDISDEDMLALLPSRYAQSQYAVDEYYKYVRNWIAEREPKPDTNDESK